MNANWLDQLAPEHAPAPPGWWPPAPGWWVLATVLLGVAIGAWVWWRSPRRRLRAATLRELRKLCAADLTIGESAQAVQNLLRRYALAVFGQETVARLNGAAWLEFLALHGAPPFGGDLGRSLLAASYGGDAAGTDRAGWFAAAEAFVRRAVAPSRRSPTPRAARPRGRPA
jgi:hypothetical protein